MRESGPRVFGDTAVGRLPLEVGRCLLAGRRRRHAAALVGLRVAVEVAHPVCEWRVRISHEGSLAFSCARKTAAVCGSWGSRRML